MFSNKYRIVQTTKLWLSDGINADQRKLVWSIAKIVLLVEKITKFPGHFGKQDKTMDALLNN